LDSDAGWISGFELNGAPALSYMEKRDLRHSDRVFLNNVRLSRASFQEQIRQSQITIEKSMELLRQMDEVIAKAEKKG
jgi:hypothetical protein